VYHVIERFVLKGDAMPIPIRESAKFNAVSLDTRIARVHALDLGPIKFKLVHAEADHSLGVHGVERIEKLYKRFLVLNLMYPDKQIVPNKEVDMFWHAHILDTIKYAEDCEQVFGRFLHHFPYFGLRGKADADRLLEAFEESRTLYQNAFGESYSASNSDCDAAQCSPQECNTVERLELTRPDWESFADTPKTAVLRNFCSD
jgi:hypothetical protein